MKYKLKIVYIFIILTAFIFSGCSGYDTATGTYEGKGVSVNFPTGWSKIKTVPNAVITVENDKGANMSLLIQKLPENITFEQYLKRVRSSQGRMGAREVENGPITLGDYEGHWSIKNIGVGGQSFTAITYSVMRDGKVFSILGLSSSETFPQWESTFDNVAKSMTLQ